MITLSIIFGILILSGVGLIGYNMITAASNFNLDGDEFESNIKNIAIRQVVGGFIIFVGIVGAVICLAIAGIRAVDNDLKDTHNEKVDYTEETL